jgi:hypothetical protein
MVTFQTVLPEIGPPHYKDIRFHNSVIGIRHLQWSDEDPHIGGADSFERHGEIQTADWCRHDGAGVTMSDPSISS